MSGPFILLSTWRIKKGQLEALTQFQKELSEMLQEREPQLIAFNYFINEEETEITSIQVHPDADSMDFHLRVIRNQLGEAMSAIYDLAEPKDLQIYGKPPDSLQNSLSNQWESVSSKTIHVAGFTRSPTT